MPRIEQKSGLVYYYGNPAGYVENDSAVLDTMFKSDELSEWAVGQGIDVTWRDGVFDKLSAGKVDIETGEAVRYKDCRIWQLKPDADPLIKYIGYDELLGVRGSPPDRADYRMALDFQPNTDNIDEICDMFHDNPNPALVGGKVNLSDIIETYDSNGSEYNYADRRGFVEVDFGLAQGQRQEREQTHGLHETANHGTDHVLGIYR
jgi:hypothetical protein